VSEAVEGQACPACASSDFISLFTATDRLYRTTRERFEIVECRRCRLIRLYPQPSPSELPQYYPESYWYAPDEALAGRLEETYRRFVLRDHVNFVRRAIQASGESEGFIVDVGCGGGLFLRMMAERSFRVTGLDFSLDAASIAWRENSVPVVCGTLSHAPFFPGSCIAVTMFHVLEHLYEPLTYLESARTLLRPGGRLIVQVPNAASWQFLLFGEHWSGIDAPRHLLNFRPEDLDVLLDRCGFEVVRRKYFSLRDNPAGFATSLAPWLDPMARRIRNIRESPRKKLLKDLLYFALVACSVPFTVLEAACHAGSTIMVEARKKA
jgi:SAM-dependent methyltransferase